MTSFRPRQSPRKPAGRLAPVLAPAVDGDADEPADRGTRDPLAHDAAADDLAQVRLVLADVVSRLDPATRRLCSYHLGFTDEHGRPDRPSGKGVRPLLTLLSTRAAGASARSGVPAAVAVELVHNFSLLHDDVMDGDTERRHKPTAWAAFGRSEAILAGDALLVLASEVLAESGAAAATSAIRCLHAATRRLIAGQMADLAFESRRDVTVAECLGMAQDKTGALLSCAASLGAVLAGGPAEVTLGLSEFGDHLGLAFQLEDDLLGIWGDPAVTGKPIRSDLRSAKKSLPVVAALGSGTSAGGRLAEHYPTSGQRTEEQLVEMARLIEAAGGRQWARDVADHELSCALDALSGLPIPADVADELEQLASRLSQRTC